MMMDLPTFLKFGKMFSKLRYKTAKELADTIYGSDEYKKLSYNLQIFDRLIISLSIFFFSQQGILVKSKFRSAGRRSKQT